MNNIKKYRLNFFVIIIAAIVTAVLLNIFFTVLTDKFPLKLDMTSNKMYGLSDKTKEYLKTYDTPVDIYILASESEQDENIRAALDKYASLCAGIKITNINVSENPTFGKKYMTGTASLQSNSVIVDAGDRFKLYTMNDLYGINAQTGQYTSLNVENKITSALKYVSSETEQKAYIIKGHNEMDISGAVSFLESENFTVDELNTLTDEIPSDASVAVIAKPTVDFSEEEISKLDAYLLGGGNLQVYIDVECQGLDNLFSYLKSWGMGISEDVVIETDAAYSVRLSGSSMSLVTPETESTEFTDSLIKNRRTIAYFPYARNISLEFETNGSVSVTPVLKSSDKAYLSSNYEDITKQSGALEGQFVVGALSRDSAHGSSVYVSGSTMLLSVEPSALTNNYGLANYDYFINLINYTTGGDDSFTVNEKALAENVITISAFGERIVFTLTVILIPAAVLITGITVWFRRRNK